MLLHSSRKYVNVIQQQKYDAEISLIKKEKTAAQTISGWLNKDKTISDLESSKFHGKWERKV